MTSYIDSMTGRATECLWLAHLNQKLEFQESHDAFVAYKLVEVSDIHGLIPVLF